MGVSPDDLAVAVTDVCLAPRRQEGLRDPDLRVLSPHELAGDGEPWEHKGHWREQTERVRARAHVFPSGQVST
jgi:hypothetical protein